MLTIGVIGLSEGNQHPYSWAAIINGDYDQAMMDQCGSPHPPAYLRANRDTLGIDGAKVTHIWTQDRAISEHCARTCRIDHVVHAVEDMIGRVDAVMLLRDDPENHVAMSRALIDAGVPLFIDKPLAYNREDLAYFEAQVRDGKHIASCSSMRYSAGVQSARVQLATVGRVQLVVAVGQKDWRKYAVHYLEGMLALLGDPPVKAATHVSLTPGRDVVMFELEGDILATVHVLTDIAPGGELNVYGTNGHVSVDHGGAYTLFRNNIEQAIKGFRMERPAIDFGATRNVIRALIAGRESLEAAGKRIETDWD
jgi:predicted dehydrogenase